VHLLSVITGHGEFNWSFSCPLVLEFDLFNFLDADLFGISAQVHCSIICCKYLLRTLKLFSRIVDSSRMLSVEHRLSNFITIPTKNLSVWPNLRLWFADLRLINAV